MFEKLKSIKWLYALRIFVVVYCVLMTLDIMFYMLYYMMINTTGYAYLSAISFATALLLTFLLYDGVN